jgi:hypothetical protein
MGVNSRYIPGDTQDVKQDANLAITQQRQNFTKNETINGKKYLCYCSFRKQREDTAEINIYLPTTSLRLHFSNSVG